MLREARATADWAVIEGTIRSSEVVERSQPRRAGSTHRFALALVYEYELDGSLYRGTRYSVAGDLTFATREEAERNARAYRPGDRVPIFHDPAEPSDAVLARGGENKAWATLAFGVVLLGAGVGLALRRGRRSTRGSAAADSRGAE